MLKSGLVALGIMVAASAAVAQDVGASKPIWQQRSIYRNIIVFEGNGHRCLTFGKYSARQSCFEIDHPLKLVLAYTQRIFDAINELPKVDRVLVIGVGGGSLPMAIRDRYPSAYIDAVELDPEVINVAKNYFQFRPDDRLSVFAEDGRVFIRKAIRQKWKYDAIVLDAFDKDYIPEHMATVEFLTQVKSVLNSNGVLLSNTFSRINFKYYEEATYQAVFGTVFESRVQTGNRIILAGKDAGAIAARLPYSRVIAPSKEMLLTDKYSPANALLVR